MSLINKVKEHYYRFPKWLLELGAYAYYKIPAKYRYGAVFTDTLNSIHQIEYLSKKELNKQIDKRFVSTVQHAYYHVPFYKKLYDSAGIDINSIKGIQDIEKLPTIDKETVKNHSSEMISDDVEKEKLIYVTTSGSTGVPVGFYQPQMITMEEWAYTVKIWSRVGYKPDSSRLVLRGKKIHPSSKDPNVFYDPLRRELSCNIFDMRDETLEEYCEAIEKYKPEFMHGYMSAIIVLAKFVERKNIKFSYTFKAVLATSENIIEDQKKYVEHVFNTRVFSFYGHSERLVIAGECEKCSSYHVEPLYGYCEILNEKLEKCKEGEIVATGFINNAMPLIRYRTGDIARWGESETCSCGRNYKRIEKVIGRWHQDMLVNCDEAQISLAALNIHSDEFDRIVRYKLKQSEKGKVEMLIQADKDFSKQDEFRIKMLLEEKVNHKIEFTINIVDSIPVLSNGKYRIIEQHLKL